ncbi:MAG TPA: NAD(P)H-hydrate dehydratase, partial [Pseudomonas sp.]|nr:NAD(P)H-hydrate dehydratase [Pseudomonas sp.]
MAQTKHTGSTPHVLSSATVARLPARPLDAQKGDFGHVLVVGGDLGTGGAVLLSA